MCEEEHHRFFHRLHRFAHGGHHPLGCHPHHGFHPALFMCRPHHGRGHGRYGEHGARGGSLDAQRLLDTIQWLLSTPASKGQAPAGLVGQSRVFTEAMSLLSRFAIPARARSSLPAACTT